MESTQVSTVSLLDAGLDPRETKIPTMWFVHQVACGMSEYGGMQKCKIK